MALAGVCLFFVLQSDVGSVMRISVDGQQVARVDLNSVTVAYEMPIGQGNVLRITPDGVCMAWADCADQVCVHQGELRSAQRPIVCLPNRVVVELDAQDDGVDMVVG